jgi:nitrate reductase gamma subunit
MEMIEIQKQIQKKYALISLLQILLIISLPTFLRLTQEMNIQTGVKYGVLCFIGISLLITNHMKSRIKAHISNRKPA